MINLVMTSFLPKEAGEMHLGAINTLLKHMSTLKQSAPRHRKTNCGEIGAVHVAELFRREKEKAEPSG